MCFRRAGDAGNIIAGGCYGRFWESIFFIRHRASAVSGASSGGRIYPNAVLKGFTLSLKHCSLPLKGLSRFLKHGSPPLKHGLLTVKHRSSPRKHGSLALKNGSQLPKHRSLPSKHGADPLKCLTPPVKDRSRPPKGCLLTMRHGAQPPKDGSRSSRNSEEPVKHWPIPLLIHHPPHQPGGAGDTGILRRRVLPASGIPTLRMLAPPAAGSAGRGGAVPPPDKNRLPFPGPPRS